MLLFTTEDAEEKLRKRSLDLKIQDPLFFLCVLCGEKLLVL